MKHGGGGDVNGIKDDLRDDLGDDLGLGDGRYDVVVVGGGAAGLAGALMLGRARRSVLVIDNGEPRNAPAGAMHGYLGHDGVPPARLLATGRAEVRGYGVRIASGTVVSAEPDEGGFGSRRGGRGRGRRVRARVPGERQVRIRVGGRGAAPGQGPAPGKYWCGPGGCW